MAAAQGQALRRRTALRPDAKVRNYLWYSYNEHAQLMAEDAVGTRKYLQSVQMLALLNSVYLVYPEFCMSCLVCDDPG